METKHFDDFDAFAESIPGIENKMLLRNPEHRAWSLSLVDLQGVHVQLGRLGSGNIAAGDCTLRSDGYLLYLPLTANATAELLKVASSVVGQRQPGEPHREGRPRIPRAEIIRRSRELLEQCDGERVLVTDLAVAADVSERTLRTGFNEYFGIGPVGYLQLNQLQRIHRELRAADPEAVTVSEVLVRHGEWEFSRFASRFRRQFGELPSETLRGRAH